MRGGGTHAAPVGSKAFQPGASSTGVLRKRPSRPLFGLRSTAAVGARKPKIARGQGVSRKAYSSRGTRKAKVVTGGVAGRAGIRGGKRTDSGKSLGLF